MMTNKQDYLGLSTTEAEARINKFGLNDVVAQKSGVLKKFLSPLYSPISLMLLGAALLSRLNGRVFDFYFILALYLVNYAIQKWQEFKADKAIQELQSKLSFDVLTERDGKWAPISAKRLVPGDYIRLGLGSIIPADGRIVAAKNLAVNEAVLTGESLPKDKKVSEQVYSGSFIATGNVELVITATGKNTSFGKTIFSIEPSAGKSLLEKDILSITRFLMIISIVAVFILKVVFVYKGFSLADLLTLDLSLIIAGIPVALPAVMAIILSIGASGLAKKLVVVRRLSALQDLANVNLLLTDKTGTLTKNEIQVPNLVSYQKDLSNDELIELARYTVADDLPDAIDMAIIRKFEETGRSLPRLEIINFVPYDSERKRATVFIQKNQNKLLVSLGAPQVIGQFVTFGSKELATKFEQDIQAAAAQGFRVLAVASKQDDPEENNMRLLGLVFLTDPLEASSKETIRFMQANGINVKMITGDNKVIAERIAKELGLPGGVLAGAETRKLYGDSLALQNEFDKISAFAEVLPKDKYELVQAFKTKYVVAATGDGINDLPALRVANVGIAVAGAVSALRSLADIVLLGPGLVVIEDAILESRKIFVRLYNYSVYRISESFRLVITILILGLAYGFYPLLPIQIILLAFLNDIPIISLAVDRVKIASEPSAIKTKERLVLSLLFGSVGVLNSILLFLIMTKIMHLSLATIQTMFFLKLTVSGHMLIFVAHTKERWFKFLPSRQVWWATLLTQIIATTLAITGWLMPTSISLSMAALVWLWALVWMQISDLMKDIQTRLTFRKL